MAAFSLDHTALVIASIAWVLYFLLRRRFKGALPKLFFSDLSDLKRPSVFAIYWSKLPQVLSFIALVLFTAAFVDPHYFKLKESPKAHASSHATEGAALYLVLDKSGSMLEEVATRTDSGSRSNISKLDLLKKVTAEFINGRPSDMMGIVSFARQADVVTPLTLDHGVLLAKLKAIGPVANKEMDGTSTGYAIYKTASLIEATRHFSEDAFGEGKPAYEIKSGIIVLVTDGFQDPNPLDYGNAMRTMGIEEAATYAKEHNVRLYIVNVEPKLNTEQYAPQRNLMKRSAELTGGKFYQMDTSKTLNGIYSEIDSLEKSRLMDKKPPFSPYLYDRISFYPYLIAAGLMALFLSILLGTTLARRIP